MMSGKALPFRSEIRIFGGSASYTGGVAARNIRPCRKGIAFPLIMAASRGAASCITVHKPDREGGRYPELVVSGGVQRTDICTFAFGPASGETLGMRDEFIDAIKSNQRAFGLELSDSTPDRLADYYELVQQYNPILHLVGPCPPEEFATRHILESLTLLAHLPTGARFADVGTGAGLPSIPCLIARDDLHAVLIESKEKKATFLQTVVDALDLADRTILIDRQFSETKTPDVRYVTCRALDRFTENLPRLLKWSGKRKLLFFGGPSVRQSLTEQGIKFAERLMPFSSQRYLFISK